MSRLRTGRGPISGLCEIIHRRTRGRVGHVSFPGTVILRLTRHSEGPFLPIQISQMISKSFLFVERALQPVSSESMAGP